MTPEEKEAMIPEAESLDRRFQAARDHTDSTAQVATEQMAGVDRATVLLDERITLVATEATKEVTHLRELTQEHFASIDQRFKERDERSKREAQDNKVAVDAAFAAQKEAAAEQNKANTKSIDKSENATAETIRQITASFTSKHEALTEKVDDLKTRFNGTEFRAKGHTESRTESRSNINVWVGVAGFVVALVAVVIMAWSLSRSPSIPVVPEQPAATLTTASGGLGLSHL